jgi:drug/metabolite transporter (DMT)-like permease
MRDPTPPGSEVTTSGSPVRSAPAPRPSRTRLYGLLALMLLIWSANYIFAKFAVREIPAGWVVCFRTVISGLLMWPIYRWVRRRSDPRLRRWTSKDVPRLLAVGVLGIVGNQMLFVVALSKTSVAHGSIVGCLSPVLVLLGSSWIGQERLTTKKIVGMLAAAVGVAVIQFGHSTSGSARVVGDLIMLGSVGLFAAFSVLGKKLAGEFGTFTVNAFAFMGGAVFALPFAIVGLAREASSHVSLLAWSGVIYMSIFPSIIGYIIYAYALRYLPASRVSSVSYLQPIGATLLAVLLLHEAPGIAFAAGAALVLGGVWVAQMRPSGGLRASG